MTDAQFEQLMSLINEFYRKIKKTQRIVKSMVNPQKPNLKKLKTERSKLEAKVTKLKVKRQKLETELEMTNKNLEILEREKHQIDSQILEPENN